MYMNVQCTCTKMYMYRVNKPQSSATIMLFFNQIFQCGPHRPLEKLLYKFHKMAAIFLEISFGHSELAVTPE